MRRSCTKTLLLFLLLVVGTCGLVGISVRNNGRVLQQMGVVSALSFLGVVADPELQAKISDLSKQIEDLQVMVTMLLPQQQEKINLLQQKQDEQQQLLLQKQLEQDRRDKEQQEAERRRQEEEARRVAEEKKREEERQRALELEKIKQLEMQKKQLELEIKLKQEEEKRKQWREEMRRKEEEKVKREEEEAKKLAEEEERKKKEAEDAKKEAAENADTGMGVPPLGDVCSAENNDVCQAETLNSFMEDGSDETIAQAKKDWEDLKKSLEEERERLKEEVAVWEEYRENEVRLSEQHIAVADRRLKEAAELEQKATVESELISALSAEMRAKFEELRGENTALKDRITLLESGLSRKIDSLSSQLEELKKRVEEEPAGSVDSSTTNVKEVQDMISKSLKLYAADEVGMPDFALESSGAVVFTIGETEPYTRDTPWMGVFGISIWRSCKTPRLAIQKDNSPGNCWSFSGDKGSLTIQLSAQVFPEYFTIDHIPLELAPNGNASSAPNHFRVLGLDYGNAPKGHVLGNYEFTEFPIQTFAVQQNPYEKYFRFVKVEILSNHGNKDYTCLYRFRVHGRPHDTDSYNG